MKLSNRKSYVAVIVFVAISGPILFSFQNCANQKTNNSFSDPNQNKVSAFAPVQDQIQLQPVKVSAEDLSTTVSDRAVAPLSCRIFVEIKDDQFSIPARDSKGLCFYKKLFIGVSAKSKSSYVQSSSISGTSENTLIQSEKSNLLIHLSGFREVSISGDYRQDKSFSLNHYLLIQKDQLKPFFVGWSKNYEQAFLIDLHTNETLKNSFKDQYSADVNPLAISELLPVGQNVNLKLLTLTEDEDDMVSDIFIVFK